MEQYPIASTEYKSISMTSPEYGALFVGRILSEYPRDVCIWKIGRVWVMQRDQHGI